MTDLYGQVDYIHNDPQQLADSSTYVTSAVPDPLAQTMDNLYAIKTPPTPVPPGPTPNPAPTDDNSWLADHLALVIIFVVVILVAVVYYLYRKRVAVANRTYLILQNEKAEQLDAAPAIITPMEEVNENQDQDII